MRKDGYVYLLGDTLNEGVYKIGVTRGKLENRIKKLQTGNPGEIYVFAYHKSKNPFFIEKRMHLRYNSENVLNEWFHLTLEEALEFNKNCEDEEKIVDGLSDNPFFMKNLK